MPTHESLGLDELRRLEQACKQFEAAWQSAYQRVRQGHASRITSATLPSR